MIIKFHPAKPSKPEADDDRGFIDEYRRLKGLMPGSARVMSLNEVGRLIGEFAENDTSGQLLRFSLVLMGTLCPAHKASVVKPSQIDLQNGTMTFPGDGHLITTNRLPLAHVVRHLATADVDPIVNLSDVTRFREWERMRKSAGLDGAVRPNSLRLTIATEAVRRGAPPGLIGTMLQESRISVRYRRFYLEEWSALASAVRVIDHVLADLQQRTHRRFLPT